MQSTKAATLQRLTILVSDPDFMEKVRRAVPESKASLEDAAVDADLCVGGAWFTTMYRRNRKRATFPAAIAARAQMAA